MKKRVAIPASTNTAELLERGRKLAATLTAATDHLKEAVADTEKAFVALRLGVCGSVLMWSDDDVEEHLTFAPNEGSWKLLIERRPLGAEPHEGTVTRLLTASHGARVEAIDFLPALLADVVEKMEAQIAVVRAKSAIASELTTTLRSGSRGAAAVRASQPPPALEPTNVPSAEAAPDSGTPEVASGRKPPPLPRAATN
jgi:hypothetical protein